MTPFEPDGVYGGIPYRVLADCSIEALLPSGLVKFRNLDQLLAVVENAPASDVARPPDILGNTNEHNARVPASVRSLDYYSLLLGAIKTAEENSAQLRALVYERARFNFKRDVLFGHSSLGLADLVQHVSDFELAVARIEANAEIDEPSRAFQKKEKEFDDMADRGNTNESEIAPDDSRENAADADEPSNAYPVDSPDVDVYSGSNAVQVLPPRPPLYDGFATTQRMEDFPYERRIAEFLHYRRFSNQIIGILVLGIVFIGTLILVGMLSLSHKITPQVATTPPPKATVVTAKNNAQEENAAPKESAPPKASPPKLPFPLPTSFGIYVLNDNKLTELQTLQIGVPDRRVALSAEITKPTTTKISDNKPAFILFRRDFRNNAPDSITLRVIGRMKRQTKIIDGKAIVKKVEGSWRIRNISYDLRVSPIAGQPEMIIARLGDDVSLAAGRYALVLKRVGYDFTVEGPIVSKEFCLEGFETTSGSIFTQCKNP